MSSDERILTAEERQEMAIRSTNPKVSSTDHARDVYVLLRYIEYLEETQEAPLSICHNCKYWTSLPKNNTGGEVYRYGRISKFGECSIRKENNEPHLPPKTRSDYSCPQFKSEFERKTRNVEV